MTTTANREIARRNLEDVWQERNLKVLGEICAGDIRYHDPASHEIDSLDGYRGYVDAVQRAFPDLAFSVHEMIADDEGVAVRWTFSGTHSGEIRGIAPTGRKVSFTGMSIYHIRDGLIREAWINWDTYRYLQQLGAVPVRRR